MEGTARPSLFHLAAFEVHGSARPLVEKAMADTVNSALAQMGRRMVRAMGWGVLGVLVAVCGVAEAQERVVYKCPGNLYTDALTAKEAEAKGCARLEGAPVTVIQSAPPTRRDSGSAAATATPSRGSDSRVDPADQKARDADKRRILEAELAREEDKLAALQAEYSDGQPERRGDERNYQKYLDRVAEMKAGIERAQADIAALKRELAKLPSN